MPQSINETAKVMGDVNSGVQALRFYAPEGKPDLHETSLRERQQCSPYAAQRNTGQSCHDVPDSARLIQATLKAARWLRKVEALYGCPYSESEQLANPPPPRIQAAGRY